MASVSQVVVARPPRRITGRNGFIDKYFYIAMSLLVAVIVVYGFSHTADANLFHATVPRPFILWIHAAAFSGWVLFFILQSALVRSHNVRVHRTLGWFGAALGACMVFLGVTTAIIMKRFEVHQLHDAGAALFLSVPFNDITCFATFFVLAVYWRKKPELHRRFIFIATAVLLAAAFGRMPPLERHILFYVGVDAVILLGVVRDLLVNRRVHTIYRIALPALIVVQSTAVYLFLGAPAWWVRAANAIAG
ncbi:MAG TPA: hypothetical protein VHY48_05060 [Acidobacteriaceae bacterium]|jgi:hypothetical protein|nr:hypothetical protein [Acidobacteriaceae bacterium]